MSNEPVKVVVDVNVGDFDFSIEKEYKMVAFKRCSDEYGQDLFNEIVQYINEIEKAKEI